MILILILLVCVIIKCQDDNIYHLSADEKYIRKIEDVLLRYEQMRFSFQQPTDLFSFQSDYFKLLGQQYNFTTNPTKILSAKAWRSSLDLSILGYYAFLDENPNGYDIYYTNRTISKDNPFFTKKIHVLDYNTSNRCYDFDYLYEFTFIVSCIEMTDTGQMHKLMKVVLKEQAIDGVIKACDLIYPIYQETRSNATINRTIVDIMKYENKDTYVMVGLPGFSNGTFVFDSVIEVYKVKGLSVQKTNLHIDDELLNNMEISTLFSLLDFKVGPKLTLYILDHADTNSQVHVLKLGDKGWYKLPGYSLKGNQNAYLDVVQSYKTIGNKPKDKYDYLTIFYDSAVEQFVDHDPLDKQMDISYQVDKSQIRLLQDYIIILQDGVLYQINNTPEFQPKVINVPGALNLIADIQNNCVIVLFKDHTAKFQIVEQYLVATPKIAHITDTVKNVTILATNNNNQTFQKTIFYRVLDRRNTKPYFMKDKMQLPPIYSKALQLGSETTFRLETIVSGPAIKLKFSDQAQLSFDVSNQQLIKLEIAKNALNDQLLFLNYKIFTNLDTCFLIAQFSDYSFQINECYNRDGVLTVSAMQSTFTSDVPFSQQVLQQQQLLQSELQFGLLQKGGYEIRIYNKDVLNVTLQFDTTKAEEQVLQYFIAGEDVICLKKFQIDIYSWETSKQVYSINATHMKYLGYTGEFQPKQIFYNYVETNRLFILNANNDLIIGFFNYEFMINHVLNLGTMNITEIYISIGPRTFFITIIGQTVAQPGQPSQGVQSVREYHYRFPTIELLKEYDLTGFQMKGGFSSDIRSGCLAMNAVYANQTVVLVLQPNTFYRDSFLKVIDNKNGYTVPQIITVLDQLYLKVQASQQLVLIRIFQGYNAVTVRLINQDRFISIYKVNATFYNLFNSTSQAQLTQMIYSEYRFAEIYAIPEFEIPQVINQYVTQNVILPTQFRGQITNYAIDCAQCNALTGNNVELLQPIAAQNNFQVGNVSDCMLLKNNIFCVKDQSVTLLSISGKAKSMLDLIAIKEVNKQAFISTDQSMILVLTQSNIQLISFIDDKMKYITAVSQSTDNVVKIIYNRNWIIILDKTGDLHFYLQSLDLTNSIWTIMLKNELKGWGVIDITYDAFNQRLLVITGNEYIECINVNLDAEFINLDNTLRFNVLQALNDDSIYFETLALFKIDLVVQSLYKDQIFLFAFTQDGFGAKLQVDLQGDQVRVDVLSVIVPIQFGETVTKIAHTEKYVLVQTGNDIIVYPSLNNSQITNLQPSLAIATYELKQPYSTSMCYDLNGTSYLITRPNQASLTTETLNNPQLKIANAHKLNETDIYNIKASNKMFSTQVQFKLDIQDDPNPKSDAMMLYLIIGGVVAIVLALILIYIICKRRNQAKPESLLSQNIEMNAIQS